MTVKTLIEMLQGYDPFLPVCYTFVEHDISDSVELEEGNVILSIGQYQNASDKTTAGPNLLIG